VPCDVITIVSTVTSTSLYYMKGGGHSLQKTLNYSAIYLPSTHYLSKR